MKIVFHPDAEAEFLAAVDYYEDCKPGLGIDFALEVNSIIANILNFPNAWPILADNLRRCLVNRFLSALSILREKIKSLFWLLCICIAILNIGRTDFSNIGKPLHKILILIYCTSLSRPALPWHIRGLALLPMGRCPTLTSYHLIDVDAHRFH